jgi:hypothetical protein
MSRTAQLHDVSGARTDLALKLVDSDSVQSAAGGKDQREAGGAP